jgi:hypothetical protein
MCVAKHAMYIKHVRQNNYRAAARHRPLQPLKRFTRPRGKAALAKPVRLWLNQVALGPWINQMSMLLLINQMHPQIDTATGR